MNFKIPCVLAIVLIVIGADAPVQPFYAQDFEKLAGGKPPEEILVLNGNFSIRKEAGNSFIELAADPIDSNGFLAGPQDKTEYCVSVRISGSKTGRRFPEFGIGVCGPGQYRLWMMPATGELQLLKGDDAQSKIRIAWESGQWTRLKFQSKKSADGKFKVSGKAWADGKDEPADWQLNFEDTETPNPGKASFWSTPYSTTPTKFDDILITAPK